MKISKGHYHHIGEIGIYLFFIESNRKIVFYQSDLLTYLHKTLLVERMVKRYLDIEMARVQFVLKFMVAYLLFILNFEGTFC